MNYIKNIQHSSVTQMPRQKISLSKKNKGWREANIDAAISLISLYNSSRRGDRYKKQKNYNLFNGKIDRSDLEYAVNPLGVEISNFTFPATIQPYDIWSPIFMELFGEDARRPFSFIVAAVNSDSVSQKEKELRDRVVEELQMLITTPDGNIDEGLSAIEKITMSYKDMREHVATKLLTYLKKDLHLDTVFQKGWEDSLIAGEEIYAVEEISNEPKVRRVNPLEVYFVLPHNSDLVDDADIIVEETYMSIYQIIDSFYEHLTDSEIHQLENNLLGADTSTQAYSDVVIHEKGYTPDFLNSDNVIQDSRGNIKVRKVTWASMKKIGRLLYLDENYEQQETIVTEDYKPLPEEKVEWMWIKEYWEGYKIGNDLYKNIRPKKLQFRRMDNLSSCKSGYVGSVYNANNAQSVSLMDRLTPFIYLYIVIWYNTELAIATNWGKIAQIDVSTIPDGWEIEKWLHYARAMKIAFIDSFNEGKKGERQGKQIPQSYNKDLNLETGNYIQQHIGLLQFIEDRLKKLSGVSDTRLGEIAASEAVGNTHTALNQNTYVTEKWFQVHNFNKQRVLEALIETAKSTWEGKSKKLQLVSDELTISFFTADMNEFVNSEFGVFVSNSAKDSEILNTLKQMMQAALQNDKASLSDIIDILGSESIAETKNKLKRSEEEFIKRQQQSEEAQRQHEAELTDKGMQIEQVRMDYESGENQLDRENAIQIAEIKALGMAEAGSKEIDLNKNSIPDVLEIEKLRQKDKIDKEKLALDRQKMINESIEKSKQRKHEKMLKDMDLKKAKKDNETKIKVSKSKPSKK